MDSRYVDFLFFLLYHFRRCLSTPNDNTCHPLIEEGFMLQIVVPYLWYFFVYSFLGWCVEVLFAAFQKGLFVNRGFLNGPICPIYGSGLVVVLLCLAPLKDNMVLLYIGSVLITTFVELVTGIAMEKLFHQRWWDYSKLPLNIGGHVCLLFSLVWGFACMLIVLVLHPMLARLIGMIPQTISFVLLGLYIALFLTDICVSIATAAKLNKRLRQIDDISAAIKAISDKLGENMSGHALALKTSDEKWKADLTQKRLELAEKHAQLTERLQKEQKRILQAFPTIRSLNHPEVLEKAKARMEEWRKRPKGTKNNPTNHSTEGTEE